MIRTCSLVCVYTLIASAITIGSSFARESYFYHTRTHAAIYRRGVVYMYCIQCIYALTECQVQNVSQPNYAVRPRYSFSCAAPCTSWDVYVLDYPAAATRGCRLPCHVSTNISGTGSVQPMGSELQMNFNGSALTLSTVLGKIRIVAQCVYEQNSLPSTYREGLMLRVGKVHVAPPHIIAWHCR